MTLLSSQLIFDKSRTFGYVPASCSSSSAAPCRLPLLPLPLQLVCACLGGWGGRQQVTRFPSFIDINVITKGCKGFFFTFLLRPFLRPRKQSRREFVLQKIKRAADGSHAGALTLKEPNRFPPTRRPVRVSFSEGNGRKTFKITKDIHTKLILLTSAQSLIHPTV